MDDGPGIAAEDLPHVFERLYVARRQPDRRETGSGLGPAIVRELVTAMGGHVRASRVPGRGQDHAGCVPVGVPTVRRTDRRRRPVPQPPEQQASPEVKAAATRGR